MDYRYTRPELLAMNPATLVEGLLREAKFSEMTLNDELEDPGDSHIWATEAYAEALRDRDGLSSLAPLLDSDDPFIAYTAGRLLAKTSPHRQEALATLRRVVSLRAGVASSRARRALNMHLYGNPIGEPIERHEAN